MRSEPLSRLSLMSKGTMTNIHLLDRASFADAASSKRLRLTPEWMAATDLSPDDVEFVRRVRDRDLADARALFAPNLTMVAILITLLAFSITWGMLLGAIVAPFGIFLGLAGTWLALRRITTTSRQLAMLDASTA